MPATKKESAIRCVKCNKLIAKDKCHKLEIKCLRCGSINGIFDDSDEQVVITDKDGKIVFMNNIAQKVTKYSLSESIGKRPTELWSRLITPQKLKVFKEKVKSGKNGYSEIIPLITKTGEILSVSLTVSPVRDAQEKIIFFIGVGKLVGV